MSSSANKPTIPPGSPLSSWLKDMSAILGVVAHFASPHAPVGFSGSKANATNKQTAVHGQQSTDATASSSAHAANGSAKSTPVQPTEVVADSKRVVNGGSGFVFEQHADGRIFIIKTKDGDTRKEVKNGTAAEKVVYDKVSKLIGAFPDEYRNQRD